MNILFVPTFSGKVHASLLAMANQLDCVIIPCVRTIIDAARNVALWYGAKLKDDEYLIFLDDDVLPEQDFIDRLTSHWKDMVTGLYRLRSEGNPLAIYRDTWERNVKEYKPIKNFKTLRQVENAGCGLVAISWKVCKHMLKKYPKPFEFKDVEYYNTEDWRIEFSAKNYFVEQVGNPSLEKIEFTHRSLSEDMIFFERAIYEGFELRADPEVKGIHVQEFYPLEV